jgi:ABC-2 type transport system ATP-binding protein
MSALDVADLRRSFGGRAAVDGVSFRVSEGEVVGLLGPNGAGKTTTMRCLPGLLRPSSGSVSRPERVGYLPEAFAAHEPLTVDRYLRYVAAMKQVDRGDVARCLSAAGASELARRPFGRLSKGQRQRVGAAQALLGSPPAYVLDEPTIGLDPAQVVDVRALVRRLADEGAAVLLSTHLLAEAAQLCDRVVVVVRGRVVADERPGEAADLEDRFLRAVAEAELT